MAKKDIFIMKTIYVSIPSLKDAEIVPSILDGIAKADYPNRIFFGVSLADVEESTFDDFKNIFSNNKNVSYKFEKISNDNAKHLKVGYGRLKAASMYDSQDYVLQIDSHTMFGKSWDTNLIDLLEEAKSFVNNDKVILTGYAGSYIYRDNVRQFDEVSDDTISGWKIKFPVFVSGAKYNNVIPSWTVAKEKEILSDKKFLPSIKFNANFSFFDGSAYKVESITEDIEFFDEELIQTINFIKAGYTLVYPNVNYPLICHLYNERMEIDPNKNGQRLAGTFYQTIYGIEINHGQAGDNYLRFISDSNNKEAISLYQKYARMNMRFGPIHDGLYIPRYFINSEVENV